MDELAHVGFRVYGVAGRSASVSSFLSSGSEIREVEVSHAGSGSLRVASAAPREVRRGGLDAQLSELMATAGWSAESSVSAESRTFVIDGAAEPFAFAAASGAWVAARDHYGIRVTVTARGVDPAGVTFERFVDPADPAAGTTADPTPEVIAGRRAAEGPLLARHEVEALIGACGLAEHRGEVLGAVLAGYRLEPGGNGRTRIGGLPDLADGEAWPHGDDGIPYRAWGCPQLLGHAASAQGEDPRYVGGLLHEHDPRLRPLDAWRVLLNVADGYQGMSFGDGGALAIVAPLADLEAGRYDRLVTEPSMG